MSDSDVSTGTTIPETLAELLTPEWLNPVLSSRFPGVEVTAVTPGPIVERVSTNARFKIEGTIPEGLPPALCAKGYFSEAGQGAARRRACPRSASTATSRIPSVCARSTACGPTSTPRPSHGVVITEDAVEAGATFCSALDPCTVERVADQLGQFAKSSMRTRGSNRRSSPPTRRLATRSGVHPERAWAEGDQRKLRRAPTASTCPTARATRRRSSTRTSSCRRSAPGAGWTIAHGDAHVGNTFVDGEGRGCLVDWQVIQFAPWWIDVGYHIASALEPDVRGGERARPAAALPRRARRGRGHERAVVGRGVGRVPDGHRPRVLPLGHHPVRAARGHRPTAAPSRHRRRRARLLPAARSAAGVIVTAASERERFEDLYDVERHVMATDGGILFEDPYPAFAELLDAAPVHEGSVRELLGHPRGGLSLLRDGPTYTAMSYEANDTVLRENQVFSSTFYAGLTTAMFGKTILEMVGDEHRRYRALVQPAFTPKRAQWWIDQWITTLVDEAISAIEHEGHAELNTDLCARIPLQTITASFGLTREEAFAFREGAEGNPDPCRQRSGGSRRAAGTHHRDAAPGDRGASPASAGRRHHDARRVGARRGRPSAAAHRRRDLRVRPPHPHRRVRHHVAPARHPARRPAAHARAARRGARRPRAAATRRSTRPCAGRRPTPSSAASSPRT